MKIRSFLAVVLVAGLVTGCGEAVKPPTDTPIIRKSNQPLSTSKPSECSSPAYEVVLTLDKALILGLEFTYNLEVQYPAADGQSKPYNQSLVEGGIPAKFRIAGNSLELITDAKSANQPQSASDAHPVNLIGLFSILKLDDTTITVLGLNSVPYLATQLAAIENKTQTVSFLDHWTSSFDFDLNADLILQETSLKLTDTKTIVKATESISPNDPAVGHASLVKHFRLLPIQRDLCAQ